MNYYCAKCKKEVSAEAARKYKKLGRTGFCMSCAKKGRPFQPAYTRIKLMSRKRQQIYTLTYEEFLEFTKNDKCTYCKGNIEWTPHFGSDKTAQAYFLDRKDRNIGYTKENCVVSCTFCNVLKSGKFSYEEFLLLSPILEEIRLKRELLTYQSPFLKQNQ